MIRAAVVLVYAALALPAAAADTKQMTDLYAGFKDGYGQLAKLTEDASVKQAKADLLERFRGHFESALSAALIADLAGAFDGAFDGLRGPQRVKDALAGEKTAIDKEIARLNGLKRSLGGTKKSLQGKIDGLGKDKTKWDGEVNRLITEIKVLGGQAALIGAFPEYAAYPGRPPVATGKARRPGGSGRGVRVATHKCPRNCLSGHGGSSGSGLSEGQKRANSVRSRFSGVADSLDNQGLDQLKWMSDDGWGAKGIDNLKPPPNPGTNKVSLPPPPAIPDLPTTDPNAGRIDDLRAELVVARRNAVAVAGRIGELAAEMAVLDFKVGDLDAAIAAQAARKVDLDAAAKAVKTNAKFNRLNGKALFELRSVTWSGATAKGVFEAGTAKVTATVAIFGRAAAVSTDWAFTDMAASLDSLVAAIRASAVYKAEIGG